MEPDFEAKLEDCSELSNALLDWVDAKNPDLFILMMALTQVLAVTLEALGPKLAPDAIKLIQSALDKIEASFKREGGREQ